MTGRRGPSIDDMVEAIRASQADRQYAANAMRRMSPPLIATTLDGMEFGYYVVTPLTHPGGLEMLPGDFIFRCSDRVCDDHGREPHGVLLVNAGRDVGVSEAERDARMVALGWRLSKTCGWICPLAAARVGCGIVA